MILKDVNSCLFVGSLPDHYFKWFNPDNFFFNLAEEFAPQPSLDTRVPESHLSGSSTSSCISGLSENDEGVLNQPAPTVPFAEPEQLEEVQPINLVLRMRYSFTYTFIFGWYCMQVLFTYTYLFYLFYIYFQYSCGENKWV